ncbi:MerR family transcriptional regulator [Vibrio nigripulchritudo]|uniref:MerR family transcriptional regulator n=1 Tax=Vibrio nigripulchritudo TaxID=28173 RepID=UPI0003B21046|nr:MerR family transcriptional regulator [Vibrio nigripulchritudo]CCN85989.1 Transcriptional regulator, MerR family [Vibrio nigripulchritudo BLFn1]CCN97787.1 Transcriptional regulator, MerR family [Vibrio nigripulchritudo ENn2]CCO56098.1 Transcriptional regulator, MerR family [Vibrio nigripulchritudo Wn13]
MDIKRFSELVGLSAHTLRYYEKIGLIRDINRNSGGRRCYLKRDIEWVKFIVRLKDTGMSLADIKEYSELQYQGDSTLVARKELLSQHRRYLKAEIEKQQNHLSALNAKIHYYEKELKS